MPQADSEPAAEPDWCAPHFVMLSALARISCDNFLDAAGSCPDEGDKRYSYDCQVAACSCSKGRYRRAYTYSDAGSVRQCFTCVACAFSPRSNIPQSQDARKCAKRAGTFTSAQQCGAAVADDGSYAAVQFESVTGTCWGCVSAFPQSAAMSWDRTYELYTCNVPRGIRITMFPARLLQLAGCARAC